ncbi:uncharacterized protein MYCFIDRAFT_214645 [Pseudocercospora fijiensis CIRAD86]|uniref:WSC domain-containing protein n=1 Tax=Pseudocercospora fijiensis (strain CIRAD86) TaxID=383855 RepID=M2Z2W8_PSEFD|nr:uncharacterized protein MYCFIDRAFT_214645 [Pseudocercospora fijiensis CIRAD86]EME84190.1 hypothetical protein MYCFIDRAFT_214645 [Pseudocercospora fijiensis CIRAD86]
MKLDNMLPYRALPLGVALLRAASVAADALSQTYCSSQNTADDSTYVSDIYQSNGLCYDTCKASYAFAVVQYQSCWCSNYIPADQESIGSCNQDCPGYPSEKCGNQESGLYGYVALPNKPSGTAGASSASSIKSSKQTSTVSISITVTPSPEVSVSYVTRTPTTSSITSSTTSSTTTETAAAVVPVTSVIRTVISGAIVTQTVTSTPVAAGGANQESEKLHLHRNDSLSGGAIAGIVIGVLAALALLGLGAFLLWRRKRRQDGEESGNGNAKNLGRNVSVLSKAGLLARNNTRPSMGERDHDDNIYQTGQNSVRHSMMFGPGAAEGVSPVSPLGSSDGSSHSRRMSKPMVYDQRLNPSALFANQEANGSRISMQDAQDYTRPLGVVNPDVRPSFESRVSHA